MHGHVARSGHASHIRCAWTGGAVALSIAFLPGAFLSACGGAPNTVHPDGGDAPGRCSGAKFCDGVSLRACHDGTPGEQLESCEATGACSLDRCTSAVCAAAERDRTSFAGCQFYTAEVDNLASDADMATSFLITKRDGEATDVLLERHLEGSWNFAGAAAIPAGQAAVRLPIAGLTITEAGRGEGGLRISSTQPVTVAQIQSDDRDQDAVSSGGTMVLPVQALGRRHMVMTYRQVQTPALMSAMNSGGGAGRLLVVGTQGGTEGTLTVAADTSIVVAGLLPTTVTAGVAYPFQLNDGEVFLAWTGDDKQDLSGAEIFASAPVAVFSGNIATTYGQTATGINSPDMAHEQMPPIAHWSYKYVAAALPPQADTCDTLLGQKDASVWRLLAAVNDTRVTFMSPDPEKPVHPALTMSAGQVIEFVANTDFVVNGNGPLLLTQGLDCEPSLSLAISADRLLENVTFSVLPQFDQMIAVARSGTEPVLLNGAPINNAFFKPAGGQYQVARVPLPECYTGICTHQLQGHFGMTLRGMDVLASYALTAPAWLDCIDPLVNCVN